MPLPEILAAPAPTPEAGARLSKRERTRRQLVAAATRIFSAHGVADATVQQIADEAEMTIGTIYNHFRTKAEIVNAVAVSIAETIRERSAGVRSQMGSGAELMASGCLRYVWLAEKSPAWALLILDVAASSPSLLETIGGFVLTELRRGLKDGDFTVADEGAALDLVIGTCIQAMRRIARGQAPAGHGATVTVAILRGLGVPAQRARAIVEKSPALFGG